MKGNEPAFPEPINPAEAEISRMQSPGSAWRPSPRYMGLTKRELFAGLIMASMAGDTKWSFVSDDGAASSAVRRADALLVELEKTNV